MRKLRILSILIVLAIALGWGFYTTLTDDDTDKGNSNSEGPAIENQITLDFWHIMNYEPVNKVIDAAVARFESTHPGVRIQQTRIKNDQFKNKLSISFGAGQPPDVFHTWGGGVLESRFKEGLVLDLEDMYADADFARRFVPAAMNFAFVNGRPLCVPADLSLVLLYYNTEIFKKVDVEVPTTTDELFEVCKKLKEAGYDPFALGNTDRWPGCFYYAYGVTRAGGEESVSKAARGELEAFNSKAYVSAGKFVEKMVSEGCFNKGFQGIKTGESRKLLFNESAAMTLMGTWLIPYASDENPAMLQKLKCFPFPAMSNKGREGDDKSVLGGINCAYAISKSCKHPELAKEFLKALVDEQFASDWAKAGRIPAVQGAKDEDFMPLTREAYKVLENASFIQMYFDQLFAPRLGEAHKETVQALLSGNMTADDVVKKMNETLEAMQHAQPQQPQE